MIKQQLKHLLTNTEQLQTDAELIQQINKYLDSGEALSISVMRDGLVAYRRELERSQQAHRAPQVHAERLPKLSNKQAETLQAIISFTNEHGYSPAIREVMGMIGHASSSTTYGVMKKLEEKGYIKINGVRAITILSRGEGN